MMKIISLLLLFIGLINFQLIAMQQEKTYYEILGLEFIRLQRPLTQNDIENAYSNMKRQEEKDIEQVQKELNTGD